MVINRSLPAKRKAWIVAGRMQMSQNPKTLSSSPAFQIGYFFLEPSVSSVGREWPVRVVQVTAHSTNGRGGEEPTSFTCQEPLLKWAQRIRWNCIPTHPNLTSDLTTSITPGFQEQDREEVVGIEVGIKRRWGNELTWEHTAPGLRSKWKLLSLLLCLSPSS